LFIIEQYFRKGEDIVLTIEELAQYDGKDGRKAYVAVDGIIYDMTDSSAWRLGMHNGFQAGKDLTEAIKNVSPHGVSKLSNVPRVGRLAE
jgi:predicted heme/steroid binding protein